MEETQKMIKEEFEKIKPAIGMRNDYFIYEKTRIENDLAGYSDEEKKYEYLIDELAIAIGTLKHLQNEVQSKTSWVDEVNSFTWNIGCRVEFPRQTDPLN